MQDIDQVNLTQLSAIKGILSDIDDTLSTQGKLTPEAYAALWDLYRAGYLIIIVTGRPAGWCDHIARFWPVHAVVGENGGFYFHYDQENGKLRQRFRHDDQQRGDFRARLDAIRRRVLQEVPGAAIASDQPYRQYDLAIDFREDVTPLPQEQILRIKEIFEQAGAHAKISSIHVNGWFGDFDKLSTARLCLQEVFHIDLDAQRDAFAFCGDSPNDEPMFAFFPLSFGMANIQPLLAFIHHPPRYVTHQPCGGGFVEVARKILQAPSRKGL